MEFFLRAIRSPRFSYEFGMLLGFLMIIYSYVMTMERYMHSVDLTEQILNSDQGISVSLQLSTIVDVGVPITMRTTRVTTRNELQSELSLSNIENKHFAYLALPKTDDRMFFYNTFDQLKSGWKKYGGFKPATVDRLVQSGKVVPKIPPELAKKIAMEAGLPYPPDSILIYENSTASQQFESLKNTVLDLKSQERENLPLLKSQVYADIHSPKMIPREPSWIFWTVSLLIAFLGSIFLHTWTEYFVNLKNYEFKKGQPIIFMVVQAIAVICLMLFGDHQNSSDFNVISYPFGSGMFLYGLLMKRS